VGAEPELCGANRSNGGTCEQVAGHGTNHVGIGRCKFHGGCTPSHNKAAAEEIVRRGTLWYGDPVDISPEDALLGEVQRTAGHVFFLERRIAQLNIESEAQVSSEDEIKAALLELSRLNSLYPAERRHLLQVCQVAIHAGLAERQVKLAERLGQQLAELLDGVLKDLDLNEDQKKKAPGVVRGHLQVLEGGGEDGAKEATG